MLLPHLKLDHGDCGVLAPLGLEFFLQHFTLGLGGGVDIARDTVPTIMGEDAVGEILMLSFNF